MEVFGILIVLYVCWRGFVVLRDADKRREAEERLQREEEKRLQREEEERLQREEEKRLQREEEERLQREEEERLKREEEERLQREEEKRLQREEEERKQLEFEKSPQGRLQKAIKISSEYELFTFVDEMLNRPFVTESESISNAHLDGSVIEEAGINAFSKVISFTFMGFHFSIVLGEMSSGFVPDDDGRYGSCFLLVNDKLVLETRASSYCGSEWYDVTKYSVHSDDNSVKLIKLDDWLEKVPQFRKAHKQAQIDEKNAQEQERKRKEDEALNKNVSLGKFDQSE
jgi:hypothetical protein